MLVWLRFGGRYMSFRNNGQKRNPKYIFSAIFLLIVGLLCIYFAAQSHFSTTWSVIVGLVMIFLSAIMFKNANEL